ncbi:MAG: hypothetical protein H7844_12080 [Nitrospirae bacterium YQR-1]
MKRFLLLFFCVLYVTLFFSTAVSASVGTSLQDRGMVSSIYGDFIVVEQPYVLLKDVLTGSVNGTDLLAAAKPPRRNPNAMRPKVNPKPQPPKGAKARPLPPRR